MTLTLNLRKILDRKQWEPVSLCPSGTATAAFTVKSNLTDQYIYYFVSLATIYQYDPKEDGWTLIPTSGAGGTFQAGSCGTFVSKRPQGTATGGSTTTLNTNLTAGRDMRGYKILITGGPGAGDIKTIASNTIGANSVITITDTFSATITSSSTYILVTGMVYFWNSGTMSASSFRVYDVFLNTWSSLSVTSGPASWATDGKIVSTDTYGEYPVTFASGTATAGGATTLTNSGKAWTTNQWSNYQVRITAGTGLGQIRPITSNTGTVLTVPTWTTNPDATSVYVIEGNHDYLYLMGNNAVTLYRYVISTNTWSTLSPGTARQAAPGAAMSASYVDEVTDSDWTAENTIQNGKYIYSFRGAAGTAIDRYDIALNVWNAAALVYAPAVETFTTGTGYCYAGNCIYLTKEATGRWFCYHITEFAMTSWGYNIYAQSTAHLGDRVTRVRYVDGATTLTWIYAPGNNQTLWFRCLVI